MAIFNHGLPLRANVISEGGTDTSKDTVTTETLLKGVTAHDASGAQITGTCDYNANTESDTVTADKLALGETAHDASGQPVTGTLDTDAIRAEGHAAGYTEGEAAGIEAGKQAEYERTWNAHQYNGTREVYAYAFAGIGWNDNTYTPMYDIIPTNAYHMFQNSNIKDIYAPLDEKGLILDFSECTNAEDCFMGLAITYLRRIDITKALNSMGVFEYSDRLKTIEALVVSEGNKMSNHFVKCSALVNLTIEGTIGQNSLNLSWSPLSKASIISVINALSDTTTGLAVTLRMSAIKTAFETSEGAADGNTSEEWLNLVATKSNWTINAIDS